MMKANENARIVDIKEALAQWPEYDVIGNRPYAKGCYLIRKARIEAGTYRLPEVVASTERNYDMLRVVESPEFHPSRAHLLTDSLEGTLFPMAQDYRPLRRRLLEKAVELFEEDRGLAGLFIQGDGIATKPVNEVIAELKAVWHSLK